MSQSKIALGAQPTLNFVATIVLAVIIAQVFVDDSQTRGFIILGGFLIGLIFAIIELKQIISKRETMAMTRETKETREKKLGRFVAELFNEDIPFDDIEQNNEIDTNKNS